MSEWFKEHAWKACIRVKPYRGFESRSLRHLSEPHHIDAGASRCAPILRARLRWATKLRAPSVVVMPQLSPRPLRTPHDVSRPAPLLPRLVLFGWDGAPGRIRTCDHSLRRRVLYPTELRARAYILVEASPLRWNIDAIGLKCSCAISFAFCGLVQPR